MNRTTHTVNFATLAPFASLDAVTLYALGSIATVYTLKSREPLYHQGDCAHSFYVVAQGGVRLVETTADGSAVNLKVYGEGEIFGLLAISGLYPHPSGAESIGDSVIVGVRGASARELALRFPQFGLLIIDSLISHVNDAHRKIRHLAIDRVERRIVRALMQYAEKFGVPQGDLVSIDVPLTQQEIAEFSGTTLESVNRTLKMLERENLIRCARQHVDILNPVRLMYLAGDAVAAEA